jgi:hypothetical protein
VIELKKLKEAYYSKEEENYAFRAYLKANADSKTLDAQFLSLHNELFSEYDCNSCRNCCKKYEATFEEDEMIETADYLGMTLESFKEKYIIDSFGDYQINTKPCVFLGEDNSCAIESCKPASCRKYPYTNLPDRLSSSLGIIESARVCPVVFEMLERLKETYDFHI